jgi:hypothetical protein
MAALAHSGDDDATRYLVQNQESAAEPLVERFDEGADAGCFQPKNASCRSQSVLHFVG